MACVAKVDAAVVGVEVVGGVGVMGGPTVAFCCDRNLEGARGGRPSVEDVVVWPADMEVAPGRSKEMMSRGLLVTGGAVRMTRAAGFFFPPRDDMKSFCSSSKDLSLGALFILGCVSICDVPSRLLFQVVAIDFKLWWWWCGGIVSSSVGGGGGGCGAAVCFVLVDQIHQSN